VQHSTPDLGCRICEDERQYVGWNGQQWTSPAEMSAAGYTNRIDEIEPGLVQTPVGNVLWDCISLIDDATIAHVEALGGIAAISTSHPHFYGSMVEWSQAFANAPIYLPHADREWVCRDDPAYVFYDDIAEPAPGVSLVRCGGHFEGSAVLHWPAGADGRGALLTGDTIQVVLDRRYVSFMRSYPNLIPMGSAVISAILARIEPLAFDRVYGGWWGRNIVEGAPEAIAASARRYLRWAAGGE
jgi:glyoxylase-like metal-dependent hydrolase (beta-lactamase superfamily II)